MIKLVFALFVAALMLLSPTFAHSQTVAPTLDEAAVDRVMREYFEAYSHGDMPAVMSFVSVPFMVQGPNGFATFTTAQEALDWYTKYRDAAVKQGYARTEWIDLGVKLLGRSYAIATGTYVRYKADGSELNRSGGTYLLNKVNGVWKIGANIGYPIEHAFKLN